MAYKDYPADYKHLVMFSGGAGSWLAARRVADHYGTDNLHLIFADTKIEDEDLYRFLDEAAADVGGKLHILQEGRDPWQVFFDGRYLGNSRIDPCSKLLKRQLIRKWMEANFDPVDSVVHLGIDWTELHRYEKAVPYWSPWHVEAPLCEKPYLSKADVFRAMAEAGIKQPRLYEMGFSPNNCGGFCIKAGQAHFKLLLEKMPERYAYHEQKEQDFQEYIGKPVTILRKQENGVRRSYSLKELREDIQGQREIDEFDIGGCGCFSPMTPDEE